MEARDQTYLTAEDILHLETLKKWKHEYEDDTKEVCLVTVASIFSNV